MATHLSWYNSMRVRATISDIPVANGVKYALPTCTEIVSSLSSTEGESVKRQLDILVDANYEPEELRKDPRYQTALRLAILKLDNFIAQMAQSVTLVEDIVTALLRVSHHHLKLQSTGS